MVGGWGGPQATGDDARNSLSGNRFAAAILILILENLLIGCGMLLHIYEAALARGAMES